MSNTTRTLARRAGLVAAAVSAALLLAACGGGSGDGGHEGHAAPSASASASGGVSAGAHNAKDVAFAQGMIPHHRQALEMARLAAERGSSAQVKDLAARIEKAQDPEIRTMSGWLRAWGEDVPQDGGGSDMPGMEHHASHSGASGMAEMPGMMGEQDMAELQKASGKDFDRLFLTMMVEHHKGALEMAKAEQAKGAYGPAKKTAGDIVTGQSAEIAEMNGLLS
ncbi:DUF305 domain-containing protein [Streptomyces sp. NPDC049915]|uniref:DUF305 domain-containing protein n=1 Tax=Streptomyces sp. NPDC049915 TaxID=3155510 RepID=UPI00342FAB50